MTEGQVFMEFMLSLLAALLAAIPCQCLGEANAEDVCSGPVSESQANCQHTFESRPTQLNKLLLNVKNYSGCNTVTFLHEFHETCHSVTFYIMKKKLIF